MLENDGARFVFAGYLIQEPFETGLPHRRGIAVATMDDSLRRIHPEWITRALTDYPGCVNATPLRPLLPDMRRYAGWQLCAYAIAREWIPRLMDSSINAQGVSAQFQRYGYTAYICRGPDQLQCLGYDVIDGDMEYLSLAHNCGYSVKELCQHGGPINRHGLFDSAAHADAFAAFASSDPGLEPHGKAPIVWEVWG